MTLTIYTIGHSTRSLNELLILLIRNEIERLADVRRFPKSKRYPHFNDDALRQSLGDRGIEYEHFPELGGRRTARRDSPNTAWRVAGFRAYADHMATPEFQRSVDDLLADPRTTAVMCAEAVPWRCHRNLLADELTRRRSVVRHIIGPDSIQAHTLNPDAVDTGTHLIYPSRGQATLKFPNR